jgi:hypothetical protein
MAVACRFIPHVRSAHGEEVRPVGTTTCWAKCRGRGDYIPPHPLSEWKAAYAKLVRLFTRVHNQFEHRATQDRSHVYFAGLALQWMRGGVGGRTP